MISDKTAEAIARDILSPYVEMGLANEAIVQGAITMIKLKCELDEQEKIIEQANASIAVHTMLLDAIKGLPDA